jgi:hypothetical protein
LEDWRIVLSSPREPRREVEGGGDYDYGWEEKGNGGESAKESLAAEVEAGKEDGGAGRPRRSVRRVERLAW